MAKGSNFERDICKQLSLWWAEKDDIFWRTAGSGARHTTRQKENKSTENSAGDICYLDNEGKLFIDYFLVELKRGYTSRGRLSQKLIKELEELIIGEYGVEETLKDIKKVFAKTKKSGDVIDPLDLIDSKSEKDSLLIQWWKKADKERKQCDRKEVIIIFQRDMKNTSIMISENLFFMMEDFKGEDWELPILILRDYNLIQDLYILNFESFLEYADIKKIKKYLIREQNEK